jgi:O-antigen/teichoic acid export membrane protein
MTMSAVLGLFFGVVVFVSADALGALLGDGGAATEGTTSVIRLTALLIPFAGVYEISMGALRACDQVVSSTLLDRIVRPMTQVGAMVVAAWLSWGAVGTVLAWALPNVVAVLVAAAMIGRTRLRHETERTDVVSGRRFWRYTGPRAVARIAQVLTQRLDVLILAAVYSIQEAAVYGTVSRLMIAGVFVATALRQTIQPQLRRLIILGEHDAVKRAYGASTTWLVLVTWPVYLAMITHAPLVMSLFGPDYVRGSDALMLLCSAMLVAFACGLVDVVLLMLGRSWLSTINVMIALVLNVALNLLLAPVYGMVGSAIAWVVAILAGNLIPLAQTARVGLHPGGIPLVTACVVATVTIGVPLAVESMLLGDGFGPFLVVLVASLCLYGAALYAFRKKLLLDQLVADIRRPRRVLVAG